MKQPKVSIIVPCYNVEAYLPRCMDSLLGQTLKEIEIILVDDESPDRVPAMCDEYARQDSRVKVVHKPNGGLGFARNSGLDVATGEYVMFVDSDDYVELDSCERFYQVGNATGADVVSGEFFGKKDDGLRDEMQLFEGTDLIKYMLDMIAGAPYVREERLHPVSMCVLCVRRSVIAMAQLRFMSERDISSEDTVFKISLLRNANLLCQLNYGFYHYCVNESSLTHTFSIDKYKNLKVLYSWMERTLSDVDGYKQRVDRFVIGDARMHILKLMASDCPKKREYLKVMLDDAIWEMTSSYRIQYIGLYQRIVLYLCRNKQIRLLNLVIKLVLCLK